jgi:hypothetical protein
MPERLDRAPIPADYLARHGVSARQLDLFVVSAMSRARNPGMSWPDFADLAEDVATRWDNVDGKLANFEHFIAAVERRAERKRAKERTTVTVRNADAVMGRARARVNSAIDDLDRALRALDAPGHVITDLEPHDVDDEHGGPRYK